MCPTPLTPPPSLTQICISTSHIYNVPMDGMVWGPLSHHSSWACYIPLPSLTFQISLCLPKGTISVPGMYLPPFSLSFLHIFWYLPFSLSPILHWQKKWGAGEGKVWLHMRSSWVTHADITSSGNLRRRGRGGWGKGEVWLLQRITEKSYYEMSLKFLCCSSHVSCK